MNPAKFQIKLWQLCTPSRRESSLPTDLVDELHNDQLQDVPKGGDLVDAGAEVVQGPLLVGVDQHHEGVTLAWHVLLTLQEVVHQLGGIGDQVVVVPGEEITSYNLFY